MGATPLDLPMFYAVVKDSYRTIESTTTYRKPSGKALVIHARDEPPFLLSEWEWVGKRALALSKA